MSESKAIGLISGGLDSLLACKIIQRQGIRVLAYNFISPFFGWPKMGREGEEEKYFFDLYGIETRVRSVWPEYMEIVRNPRYGYGKNINPCLDCKIFMLKKAGEAMEEERAAFVFTGEVLGQRPMSQRRDALNLIEKQSGLKGRLVRPLSAKLLPLTIPEEEGTLDRELLYDFSGRNRKPQMALAEEFGITEYPSPAGGCCLTDPGYSQRLRDLLDNQETVNTGDIEILGLGRHFRLGDEVKLVVGRNQGENQKIHSLSEDSDLVLKAADIPGPTAILRGPADHGQRVMAARITARYASHQDQDEITVLFSQGREESGEETVSPAAPEEISPIRI